MSLTDESDALHARVRAFARGQSHEGFDALALEIAQFQRRWSAGFRRLCAAHGGFSNVDEIPAVPSDAFRLARVAVHPPQLDVARFMTSGTSGSDRGVHALRTLETYSEVARAWGSRGLCSPKQPTRVVLALAEDPGDPGESSLGHMMRLFMGSFDGRARDAWLIGDGRVRLEACDRALGEARAVGEPLLVLAPAFALVALLEALNGRVIEAPAGTVVMQTGGFKGRTREIDPNTLRAEVARTFCIPPEQVVGEYGMTELSSQLYEGTLPGGELAAEPGITQVEVTNARPYEISIEVPEANLRRHGLSFDQVAQAVRRSSLDLPGGTIKTEGGEILLRSKTQAYVGRQFEELVVLSRADGTRVKLGDVAQVVDGFEDTDQSARFDGKPAVMVRVYRIGDQDVIEISDAVKRYVQAAQSRMPEGISISVWRDSSVGLRARLSTLYSNGIQGLVLVVAILMLFLRARVAL